MRFFLIVLLGCAACDQLNRPIGRPASSSSGGAPSGDAGTVDADGGSPPPAVTAQPGDIQI